jgi:hypothetical protein
VFLTCPVESHLIIQRVKKDSEAYSHRYKSHPTSIPLYLPPKNQRPDSLVIRRFLESERTFKYRSKSKVSMTLRILNGEYSVDSSWYLNIFKNKLFNITLNIFTHSSHDACCGGCDVLRLQYKNVVQAGNNEKERGGRKEDKIKIHDLKLESAIWSVNLSHIEYPLPLTWFEGFGEFIHLLMKWSDDVEVSRYAMSRLQKLSIVFKEFTVPKSKDLLRYFPAEITER